MQIFDNSGNIIIDIDVDDKSYRNRIVMGDHNLTLYYSLAKHIELPVGCYCEFEGHKYTLMRPEQIKMKHSRYFNYTVTFSSDQDRAKMWKFRNPVDGRLKFNLTAKPKEHLQMFVDNMNRRDFGWTVGDCVDDVETLITYDHDYCWDALTKQATTFKTEFEIEGKRVSLRKVEYNKDNPLHLSYGKGNGFKSGIGRCNDGDTPPIEILFVQGGDRNIDRSKYPASEKLRTTSNGCLLLPTGQTIAYDGEHFEDEAGFNSGNAQHYIVDDLGLSIRNIGKTLTTGAEDSLDRSDDYPKRIGTISGVEEVDKTKNLYDFIDSSIPEELNYEDYLIGEDPMTVIFKDGMLAGREFDVKYYHEAKNTNGKHKAGRRFEIVPQEIDGIMMPGGDFIPKENDKYAVFNVMLPDSYIRNDSDKSGASWDMFRAAVKYLFDNEHMRYTFTGELDGLWAKKDWNNIGGKIKLGGYVRFTDDRFEKEGILVRITAIKDYINSPHSPKIELSNKTQSCSVASTIKQLESPEVVIEENHQSAIQYTKRRYRDAKETIEMLEAALSDNFSDRVNPIAVETMSLLVGDERLQYQFVSGPGKTDAVPHNISWNSSARQLIVPSGTIQHLTLGIDSIRPSHDPNEYRYWNVSRFESASLTDGSKKYYLYIRAPREYDGTAGNAIFSLETDAHKLNENAESYWLLVGILNSEYEGERSFVTLYGFTEVLPGRITADRLLASDGESYFDMVNAAMKLKDKLQFNVNGDGELRIKGVMVQSQNGIDEAPLGCYRGEYNADTTYFNGDEVVYRPDEQSPASSYRCISPTPITGVPPTDTLSWQVSAAGVAGEPGKDGISPNASFKSTVFCRTNSNPARPTGGSFSNPVPTGWSDGIPAGEAKLWASTRIFTTDGKAPQQSAWTAPRQMTDTADFDVEFSSEENPTAPAGHPNTNTQWSNESSADTIWMATSRKSNGVWQDWQVARIKGESGEDGSPISIKGDFNEHYATKEALLSSPFIPMLNSKYLIDKDEENNQFNLVATWSRNLSLGSGFVYGFTYALASKGEGWVRRSNGHLFLPSDNGWVDTGQFVGEKGADGTNAYLHIKFANSLTANDWTANNGETPGEYIGIYADNNPTDSSSWSDYKWMKWTGQDGLGYEFIYKRTASSSAPSTPSDISQTDGFVPSGWTDDPTGVTSSYPYEWVCYRKKTEGAWGEFIGSASNNAVAALWAKYGQNGATGNYTEYKFAVNGSTTTPPNIIKHEPNPAGWSTAIPTVNQGYYLWMTKAVKKGDDGSLVNEWSTPVRFSSQDGKDGKDGKDGLSPALVFRGYYDNSKIYYGNQYRIDCVRYGDSYYAARVDAGTFSSIIPSNTSKWNPFGASFDSVATGLLLAENANIANLIFRNQRLESLATTNGIPNFFIDGLKNIASFAAGKAVFDGAGARIGWIFIDGKDLVGVDSDGVERLRITPNALPAVNTAGTTTPLIVKSYGGDANYIGETSTEVAFEYDAYYSEGRDNDPIEDNILYGYVEYDIVEDSTRINLSELQPDCQLKDINGNAIPHNKVTESLYANVLIKNGNTWNTIGSVALSQGQREITIPMAGRIRIAIYLSVYVTGYSSWHGTISVTAQGIQAKTTKEEVFIAKDGIMAIYNANYLRFHSGEGLIVRVGNYGMRITTSGIQKTSNGGSSWSSL
jgi:hypothetical protein